MYSSFQLALKYISYQLAAASGKGHGIHSPFVFDFITNVLNDRTEYLDYDKIESVRRKSLRDQTILKIEDHGAGSSSSTSKERSVSSIARHAVKSKKYAQLLYRIVKYYQPTSIIELGTSLGITTSYLSSASPEGNVFTLEGSMEIANIARQNFKTLELQKIKVAEGNFDYTLPSILYHLTSVDLAFIDGNHRHEPTEKLLSIGYWKKQIQIPFLFLTTFIGAKKWNRRGNILRNILLCGVPLIFFLSASFFSGRNSKRSSISLSGSDIDI